MSDRSRAIPVLASALLFAAWGCGARTELADADSSASVGGATSSASTGGTGGAGGSCVATNEECNGLDDDCDGDVDEDFGVGSPCDGPDTDLCNDDVMTCEGCSIGPDELEVCNGQDDDCDGIVDADCEVGGCTPDLLVLDVQKSMRSCFVDAVQPGSMGSLDFPCTGGPVSSMFGPILFTGNVTNGLASLTATTTFDWLDGCTWESSQTITGKPSSGTLAYTYAENPIEGVGCLPPCSASGTIQVLF